LSDEKNRRPAERRPQATGQAAGRPRAHKR